MIEKKHAYYSHTQRMMASSSLGSECAANVYRSTLDGSEVVCTEVCRVKKAEPFGWSDMVYLGQVSGHIHFAKSTELPDHPKLAALRSWLRGYVKKNDLPMPPPQPVCDCGGRVARSSHTDWCSTQKASQ